MMWHNLDSVLQQLMPILFGYESTSTMT